jgi:hypothetical protein
VDALGDSEGLQEVAEAPGEVEAAGGAEAEVGGCVPARPGPGVVRARVIQCADELRPGYLDWARVGDLVLENSQARFVVRTGDEGAALLGLSGGGLVDASLSGPGSSGADLLREVQPLVNYNLVQAQSVSITADGAEGEARVTVLGVPIPHPVLASVVPSNPLEATITHEYVLKPDQPWITLRTRVKPTANETLSVLPADMLFPSGLLQRVRPGQADQEAEIFKVPFFVLAHQTVSYAYVAPPDTQGIEIGGAELLLGKSVKATQAQEAVVERYLVVGDGSLASVGQVAWDLLGVAGEALAELPLEPDSGLEVLVSDGAGTHVPARLTVERPGDPSFGPGRWFSGLDKSRMPLAPGTYRVTVSRGFEYERVVLQDLLIAPGAWVPLEATLERSVKTPGALATELHIHSELSVDSAVPLSMRVQAIVAEGVEFTVATDHDFVTDYLSLRGYTGFEDFLHTEVGCEVSSTNAGHFMAWPLIPDPDRGGFGAPRWYGLSPQALVGKLRAEHPGALIQVNHPRFDKGSTFNLIGYDPADGHAHGDLQKLGYPEGTDLDFMGYDAIEVFNAIGDEQLQAQLTDWYSLLNQGLRVTATAGGDSHSLDAFPGNPRNLVLTGNDDPRQATAPEVQQAIRAMRVLVSSGPYIDAGLEDPMSSLPSLAGDLVTDSDGEARLYVAVQCPTWMDLDQVVVVANGVDGTPIPVEQPAAGTTPPITRYQATLPLAVDRDTWFVVMVRGDLRDRVMSNHAPFAVTNPFYLDADGDGKFTAPGL